MGWRLLLNSTAVRMRALEVLNEKRPVLDNAEDLRAVVNKHSHQDARIHAWARLRTESLGIQQRIDQWSEWIYLLAFMTFVVLAGFMATGLASVALPEDRRVNAAAALVGLLGIPTMAFLLWLLSFAVSVSALLGGIFGCLVRLVMRWKSSNDDVSASLAKGCSAVLRETGLGPWMFGRINHLLWLVALVLTTVVTWGAFMFQAYRFGWETTVLSQDFFVELVHISGFWAPIVGADLPAPSEIGAGWASEAAKTAWARWLVGCLLVWALLPRFAAWILCCVVWKKRTPLLDRIPLERPFVQALCAKFEEWDRQAFRDAQSATVAAAGGQVGVQVPPGRRVAAIGWELPLELEFPWKEHQFPWIWVQRLPGSLSDREGVIDTALRSSISTVVLVVMAGRTPDLATERLIQGLQRQHCRIVLLPLGDDATQRWKRWREARRITDVAEVSLSDLDSLFAE